MLARIYSIIFLALLILGFIYQESYMQMSMSETSQKVDAEKFPVEVFAVTPLRLQQYRPPQGNLNGPIELTGELTASEGRFVSTGKFTIQGHVFGRFADPSAPQAEGPSSVKGEKLLAYVSRTKDLSAALFGGDVKIERVEIPGPAEIMSRGHLFVGRAFHLDVQSHQFVTKSPVLVKAINRQLEAQGVEVELRSRNFKFTGPVRGIEIPTAEKRK